MNGAHALLSTLRANDVTVCFANPGTSEMHFVAGLDDVPEMRGVLCLFEGVATGAADGYARVTGRPACTLLHLGPGLGNGFANLHNARRARSPVVNIVGDHATYHAQYDAPLQSDLDSLTHALGGWQRRSLSPNEVARDAAEAVGAALGPPGRVATLILPADSSWGEVATAPDEWPLARRDAPSAVSEAALARAVELLRTGRCALFLGGSATSAAQLALAHRVVHASGSRMFMETFPAIVDQGAGIATPERLIYLTEFALGQLSDLKAIILVGAKEPVGFFAYPNVASRVVAEGCEVLDLAPPGSDTAGALEQLGERLGAGRAPLEAGEPPGRPTGDLNSRSLAAAVASTMPEDLIVADESNVSGIHLNGATRFAPPHRWMTLTGGSIGFALPAALGAALASERRVLALESDGSMMYTPQALWTMAREGLDVTVVGLANRSYAVLNLERQRVGADRPGTSSTQLLDLDNPTLDLASIASAQGVPSCRVTTADELVSALERSYATPGPMFIEAALPKGFN